MAYETKVILTILSERIAHSKNVKEAYNCVVRAANAEGMKLPNYDEYHKMIQEESENGEESK